jgi:hypothetical protein
MDKTYNLGDFHFTPTVNYKLAPDFAHHLIDIDAWSNLTEQQRESKEKKFREDKGRQNSGIVI